MPLIAMTREMGSLGKDVASAISSRMGKPVVHHEIIDQLADKMRFAKAMLSGFWAAKRISGSGSRLTRRVYRSIPLTRHSHWRSATTSQLSEAGAPPTYCARFRM